MINQEFYVCRHCGNIIAYVNKTGVPVMCCGEKMQPIVPCSVEASTEKHIPAVFVNGNNVTVDVGSVAHPMGTDHFIQWISLQTEQGNQRKELKPEIKPEAVFVLAEGDKAVSAYAYCNLHGLWKKDI